MTFFQFIRTKLFFKHLMLSFLVTILAIWILLQVLKVYTRHGQMILLGDFIEKPLSELAVFADDNSLEVIVNDSVYDPDLEPGTIKVQDPLPNTNVKKGRKVYVTIVSTMPENVVMPNLIDLSLRQAVETVETAGLRTEKLIFVDGDFHNAVSGQQFNGRHINAGKKIPRGSKITILVQKGYESGSISVPKLTGMSPSEAYRAVFGSGLNTGKVEFTDHANPSQSSVYKQYPSAGAYLPSGSKINIWFKEFNADSEKEQPTPEG
jgi:beta-lactam-binding protein with PASTA domain